MTWQPHQGQQRRFLASPAFEALFGGAAGPGKALTLDTCLPTIDGWTTMEAVKVGDVLFDEMGQQCRVIAVSPIMCHHQVYEVVFDDGSIIKADGEHIWRTFTNKERAQLHRRSDEYRARRRATRASRGTGKKPWLAERNSNNPTKTKPKPTGADRTTEEIAASLMDGSHRNHAIVVANPIQCPEKALLIDPYVLGYWLGDGISAAGGVTSADRQCLDEIEARGHKVKKWKGDRYTYGVADVTHRLRSIGVLRNKHIPADYLRASEMQRWQLLFGLMDSDGTCDKDGYCEFYTTSEQLSTGVLELLLTLGIKCRIKTGRAKLNGKDCGPKYRIGFTTAHQAFILDRKRERQITQERGTQNWRYIVDVREISSEPVKCIAVDSRSKLYLAGNEMIPTHNTDCLVMEALRQIEHPLYTGIIFRRTFTMLEQADGIIQRSQRYYPTYGGVYNWSKHYWNFPSGAMIYFSHMQHIKNMLEHQGAQYCFVGFDEVTEFEKEMYMYLFTRCRPPAPDLRAYIRGATNPGNIGHKWVKDRFVTRDITNRLRYFAPVPDADGKLIDTEVARDYPNALSRAYYPARMSDNPSGDPNYASRIMATGDPVVIAQLIEGDWDAVRKQGLIYDTWSSAGWPDGNICSDAEYRDDLPLYWACDDGYVYGEGPGHASYHPRVVLFVQDNEMGGLDIIDEYVACEETHAATLTNIRGNADGSPTELVTRWMGYKKPSVAYVPSEAALMKGEIHKFGITTVNATHRVGEGIKAMRQTITGRHLRVNPRCAHVLYEVGSYRSDPRGKADTGEVVPLKIDDHTMDAARYLIFKRRHMTG